MDKTKMKGLIKDKAAQSYTYAELDIPKPKEDEILVKVEAVAICGSDIPLYKWDAVGQKIATIPFVPGRF
jgi:D-arabinose 1-dehydrogenase-like Zn-dependent alcohol dehydrogenase